MSMKVKETVVEVDMVPLIDIVTLVLLFLVIVGDMAKSASAVKMKLPRLDQAKTEKELKVNTEGRITVQIYNDPKENRYLAKVENNKFEIAPRGDSPQLKTFLDEQVNKKLAASKQQKGPNGEVPFPVKLRIPEDAPMMEVERVVLSCARSGLQNVHYASEKPKGK